MSDIKQKYPSSNTAALNITLASLASSSTLIAGNQSDIIDNSSNLDLDHLVSGMFKLGTSPTAAKLIEVWAFAPISILSGTSTYPDTLTASAGSRTLTSLNGKAVMMVQLWSISIEATNGQVYYMPPTSIARAFGDMPQSWGVFVTQNTGVALDSTSGNHGIWYQRIQKQTV